MDQGENIAMLKEDTKATTYSDNAMNVMQVARYLGVTRWTIYRLCDRKEIPYTPYGRAKRFYKDIIDPWRKKRSVIPRD